MRLLRTREGSRGLPLSDFRASVPLRRVGPEETAAERIRSILWSRRTSRASNTRSALTTRRWCSTPLKEEATPGPVANRCRNGSSCAPASRGADRGAAQVRWRPATGVAVAADKESCRPDFAVALYPGHFAVPGTDFALNPAPGAP